MSDLVHERDLEKNVSEMLSDDLKKLERFRTAMQRQEGGLHYKFLPIQPIEFCQKNHLNYCESNVIKYVCRHRNKNGEEDIRKAIHNLELLLELEYGDK